MSLDHRFATRIYWDKYIDSIINSIKEDKDTIIDMLIYGCTTKADITMHLNIEKSPTYEINVEKIAKDSPFGEDDDE